MYRAGSPVTLYPPPPQKDPVALFCLVLRVVIASQAVLRKVSRYNPVSQLGSRQSQCGATLRRFPAPSESLNFQERVMLGRDCLKALFSKQFPGLNRILSGFYFFIPVGVRLTPLKTHFKGTQRAQRSKNFILARSLEKNIPTRTKKSFSLEIFILGLKFSFLIENFNSRPCFSAAREGSDRKNHSRSKISFRD